MIPKFRVWDKSRNLMIDEIVVIDLYNEYIGYLYPSEIVQGEIVSRLSINDVIIMQSTGLKDENGVEIYEGDVLTLKYPRDRRYTVTAKVIRGTQISAMMLKFEDEFTTEEIPLYKISAEHNLEVIGNIYENKELLEVIK